MNSEDASPIIFYQYFDTTDIDFFQDSVRRRFRDSGHERDIEFRVWNCYRELPGRDGDMFSYDCVALSALCDQGYIQRLPDIVDTTGVFDWLLDTSKYRRRLYGLPFLTCTSALICRREDGLGIRNIRDLDGRLVTPLRSMLGTYYLQSFVNFQDGSGRLDRRRFGSKAAEIIGLLARLMGGLEEVERSALGNFDGVERFNRGEVKYFLGFTEFLRLMDRGDYLVLPMNLSGGEEISISLFNTDVLSVGASVRGEKLLDCLDLLELITSPEFEYDICAPEGRPSYMLPANSRVYPRLMELDGLYDQLYRLTADEKNCVLRFPRNYYDEFPALERTMMDTLRAGAAVGG